MLTEGKHNMPGCEPQPMPTLHITITLGGDMQTPHDALQAVTQAMNEYGLHHKGTLTPFAAQPGFPGGAIHTRTGHHAGDWWVTS